MNEHTKIVRDRRIDVLKAWGIVCVTAEHAGSPSMRWLASFPMPLFFFVVGYLRYGRPAKPWPAFVKGKLRTSLLPYAAFLAVSMVYVMIVTRRFALPGMAELKALVLGGQWLRNLGYNFPLWYFHFIFFAVLAFECVVRYLKPWMQLVTFVVSVCVTLPFQRLVTGLPPFEINILPTSVAFMLIGYGARWALDNWRCLDRLKDNIAVGGTLVVAGWWLATIHYGNVANIVSYLYYPAALCTTLGFFILSGRFERFRLPQYISSKIMYILGLHLLVQSAVLRLTQTISERIELTNAAAQNLIATALILIVSCGAAELWGFARERLRAAREALGAGRKAE